jgi:hypothetical protein
VDHVIAGKSVGLHDGCPHCAQTGFPEAGSVSWDKIDLVNLGVDEEIDALRMRGGKPRDNQEEREGEQHGPWREAR